MSRRIAFLDEGLGETRGGLLLDGRPERLILDRPGQEPRLGLGARLRARVREVEPALGLAFLDLGGGAEASLVFKPDSRPRQGQALEVEIRSEPREGKLATVRVIGEAEGAPELLAPAPDLRHVLEMLAGEGELLTGAAAREAADLAEAEILETIHPLPGGGSLAIEPTRALTAVDIDVGSRKGAEAKKVTRQANMAGLAAAARLLRLKGLGGLVVIDLAGRGHDGTALLGAARTAFAADNPGVSIGPVSRFGTLEMTLPRRSRPVIEQLRDPDGRVCAFTLAQRLVRRLEAEARAAPGAQLVGRCAPAVAAAAAPALEALAGRVGRRFVVEADPTAPWDLTEAFAR